MLSDNRLRDLGIAPFASNKPAWISESEGSPLTKPRAATLGGDFLKRNATLLISSFVILSAKKKENK